MPRKRAQACAGLRHPTSRRREAGQSAHPASQGRHPRASRATRPDRVSVAVPPNGNEVPAQKVLARGPPRRARRYGDVRHRVPQALEARLRPPRPQLRRPSQRHLPRYRHRRRQEPPPLRPHGHRPRRPAPGPTAPCPAACKRGCLYGRGAWDMKGGLVAQFAVLMALQAGGVRLRGDVMAESVVDEEWAGGGGTLAARLRGRQGRRVRHRRGHQPVDHARDEGRGVLRDNRPRGRPSRNTSPRTRS